MSQPKRALIVIDVQNEYFSGQLPIEYPDREQSLTAITRCMDVAQAANIPVVVVQHVLAEKMPVFARGSHGVELHAQIAQRPYQLLIEKQRASALAGTELAAWLHAHSIDTVTLVGYMTHNCIDSTARHAAHSGWKVEVLADATGSLPYRNAQGSASAEQQHRHTCIILHSNFAAVVSSEQWCAAVAAGSALSADNIFLSHQRAVS